MPDVFNWGSQTHTTPSPTSVVSSRPQVGRFSLREDCWQVLIGGQLRYLHIHKKPTVPKCGDCGLALSGVRRLCIPSYLLTIAHRFQLSVQEATQPSLSAKSPSLVLMVVAVALTASVKESYVHSWLRRPRSSRRSSRAKLLSKISIF